MGIVLKVLTMLIVTCITKAILSSPVIGTGGCRRLLAIGGKRFAGSVRRLSFSRVPLLSGSSTRLLNSEGVKDVMSVMSRFRMSRLCSRVGCRSRPIEISPLGCTDIVG